MIQWCDDDIFIYNSMGWRDHLLYIHRQEKKNIWFTGSTQESPNTPGNSWEGYLSLAPLLKFEILFP